MNIAIIISIVNYQIENNNLPGCANDGFFIKSILEETKNFENEDILFLTGEVNSSSLKKNLTNFIEQYKDKKIEEIFFYYSGHGDYENEEFYYILSDFDERKKQQTSLTNSELDVFLKNIQATLTIKVVDACFSQTQYIKGENSIPKLLEKTKNHFKDCYFMFSCLNYQPSYQNEYISYFTESFIKAIVKEPDEDSAVRYKDIMDFISDDFQNNNQNQTPYFVNQARLTEIFGKFHKSFKQSIIDKLKSSSINPNNQDNKPNNQDNKQNIINYIINDSKNYCKKQEFVNTLEKIKDFVKDYKFDWEQLYKINILFNQKRTFSEDSEHVAIGKWLKENKHEYFAEIEYEKRRKEVEVHYPTIGNRAQDIFLSNWYLERNYKLVEPQYEEFVTGFFITDNPPFDEIQIKVEPEYPNLKLHECKIWFVYSLCYIRFFYKFSIFKLKNWDEYIHEQRTKWITTEIKIKDKVEDCLKDILDNFNQDITNHINSKINFAKLTNSKLDEN